MTARMLIVRSTAPLHVVASIVRDQVPRVDPDAQVVRVAPFAEMLNIPLARPRFYAFILGVFSLAALTLTTIGLYGVIAANVRQRNREIGIRMALGASIGNVRGLVLQDALSLSGVGAAAGLITAAGATRLVRSMLFETNPLDPSTLALTALTLIAASALASYVPMRRATQIDPATMLQAE
jgi:ABC-type antimicrobial peptide transport system permease subunit